MLVSEARRGWSEVESMAKSPLISVVVTFYNVAPYVKRCVDSLLAQKGGAFELVLVDDGSVDETRSLLDGYAEKKHVKIVYKANGGLSDARNVGVANSSGRYVTFVDGDDFVSPYFIESLACAIGEHPDSMIVGPLKTALDNDELKLSDWKHPQVRDIFSQKEALEALCVNEITESSCAKLLPREVLIRDPFPSGAYYEDLYTVGSRIESIESVVVLDSPIYCYLMRPGSIVRSAKVSYKQISDYVAAMKELLVHLQRFHVSKECIEGRTLLTYARILPMLPFVCDEKARALDLQKMIRRYVVAHFRDIAKNDEIEKVEKVRYLLIGVSPSLYRLVMKMYSKVVKHV